MAKQVKHILWQDDLICNKCSHYLKNKICKAFPDGIPDEIYYGWIVHSEISRLQQGDFIFEKREGKKRKDTSKDQTSV
jgi:hypothetical protein